jgi:ribosomal protein L4
MLECHEIGERRSCNICNHRCSTCHLRRRPTKRRKTLLVVDVVIVEAISNTRVNCSSNALDQVNEVAIMFFFAGFA